MQGHTVRYNAETGEFLSEIANLQGETHGMYVPHQLRCIAVRYGQDETRLSDDGAHVNDV
jgi:hypothetical protein